MSRGTREAQVDAIEQRARRASAGTARPGRPGSGSARRGSPSNPHGHGFAAATSVKRAGNSTDPTARVTTTRPSSSGWRSAFDGVAPELGELVEEQHAVVRERDLARAQVPGAAAEQPGRRDRVVRRAERARRRGCPARRAARRRSGAGSPRAPPRGSARAGSWRAAAPAWSCPRPASPTISRLCPPAAATSSARRACAWPRTSREVDAVGAGRARARLGVASRRRLPGAAQERRPPRRASPPPTTSSPSTCAASSAFAAGTTTPSRPRASRGDGDRQDARRRQQLALERELAGEDEPVERAPAGTCAVAASTPIATGRSSPGPPCGGCPARGSRRRAAAATRARWLSTAGRMRSRRR